MEIEKQEARSPAGKLPSLPPWHGIRMSPVFISSVISSLEPAATGGSARRRPANVCNQRKRAGVRGCASPDGRKELFHFESRREEEKEGEKTCVCIFPDFQSSSLCLCQCCSSACYTAPRDVNLRGCCMYSRVSCV